MQLIAVPFTPTYAEYIYLKGRRVLADQMQYVITSYSIHYTKLYEDPLAFELDGERDSVATS